MKCVRGAKAEKSKLEEFKNKQAVEEDKQCSMKQVDVTAHFKMPKLILQPLIKAVR